MNNLLINSLKNISEQNFLTEKILVCPSFGIGNQILENLAKSGCSWINYKTETINSLATQITETEIYERNLKAVSLMEINFLMDEIFTKLSEESALKYFKKHAVNKGIIKALSENITELKLAGITPEGLEDSFFINKNKASDLKLIFKRYENILKEKSLIDFAGIISLANAILTDNAVSKTCNPNKDKIFIVPAKNNFKKIERYFLNIISSNRLSVINEEKVYNLERPKNRLGVDNKSKSGNCIVSKFSFLFDLQNLHSNIKEANDDFAIEIFDAPNYRSEIYEVLNRLAADRKHIDNAEIIYANPEPYLEFINNLSQKLEIPADFSSGLPGDKSRIGKCLKGFLLWIKDDFLEVHLRNLLKYNLLKFESKNIESRTTGSRLAFMLRTSKIGWGRERYKNILEKSISEIKAKIEEAGSGLNIENNLDAYKNRLELLIDLKEISMNLLRIVPEIKGGKINFKQLCSCCLKFLSDFVKVTNEDEASYLKSLKENISTMEFVVETNVLAEEAVLKIIELIKDIRFLKSGPKPGHLFVSDLENGGMSGRDCTFIVGMDENKFPGIQIQNPVMLDEEREKISIELELSRDRLKEKLYDFTSMLSGLKGKLFFSYTSYDIKNEKNLYPSSVLLQIYRLKTENNEADYNEMLSYIGKKVTVKANAINDICIDESSLWLNKMISDDKLKDARVSVLKIYPWLKKGINAINCRCSSKLTAYDGWIKPLTDELDPRKHEDNILSCTGIESYAHSPYAYFLEKVLKVKRPEEIKKDLSLWLDPLMRGSLLHDVFQDYTEKLKTLNDYPDMADQRIIINSILKEKVEKYMEEVPIPGKAVFDQEVASLKRDLDIFLEINKSLKKPHFLEYEFGYKGKEKISINIGKDTYGNDIFVSIAGKIDRVDKADTDEYHVWDYKTGSSYSYEEEGYVCAGRQLQHILYAKVIENILKKTNPGAKVTTCGYIFPTEKGRSSGKGCIFKRNTEDDEKWQGVLNCIFDLMANGVFIFSDESMPFSDDDDIYGSKSDIANIKVKISNPENTVLEKWKELKNCK
ncbi:MAG: PD-(D/E)XK nuclease family protein [Candidatus Humimicrobiaceae bacterium]